MTNLQNGNALQTLTTHIDRKQIPQQDKILSSLVQRLEEGAMISYAQNYEDVILNRVFKDKTDGVYIDVGAFDPYLKSVTCHFHKKGWTGVNIDLCSDNITKFNEARPKDKNICCAVGATNGKAEFFIQPGTTRSTILADLGKSYADRGVKVERETRIIKTLTDILDEEKIDNIDFLSIDVEGAEKDVLLGLDFKKYRPTVILAEATFPETDRPNWDDWEPILLQNDYLFVYFDGLNRFYLDKNHEQLEVNFERPPNYFDNYFRYDFLLAAMAK